MAKKKNVWGKRLCKNGTKRGAGKGPDFHRYKLLHQTVCQSLGYLVPSMPHSTRVELLLQIFMIIYYHFNFNIFHVLKLDLISSLNVTETCSVMSGVSITTGTKSTGPDTEKKINICDTQLGQCQKAIMVSSWIDHKWVSGLLQGKSDVGDNVILMTC